MANDNYDVFISYSSEDRTWAEHLSQDLENKGFHPYRDRDKLIAGDDWENELIQALEHSQHLVVLWSEKASQSNWVREEYTRFDQIQRDFKKHGRRITILLEGENRRFSSYQTIKEIHKKGAYAAGFEILDKNVWKEVLMQVERALKIDDTSIPIPLAIITTTRERLSKINPDEKPDDGTESLNGLLASLKLTRDDLLQYYSTTRPDWQPFGGSRNIITVMDDLKDEINRTNKDHKFRWEPIDDVFWSPDLDKVDQEFEKLLPQESDSPGLAVIIIDPISFYDTLVQSRFSNYIYQCLNNSRCMVMILPPFPIPESSFGLRAFLKRRLAQIYKHFYESISAANCNLYISENLDIQRFLMWALQPKEPVKPSSPLTGFGAGAKP